MLRTRASVIEAMLVCVERYGVRKTTMADLASRAKVAKATLYNHFRTKDAVLAAVVDSEVDRIAGECRALAVGAGGLVAALSHAAVQLGSSAALRRAVMDDPVVAAAFATPTDGPRWVFARAAVQSVLAVSGVCLTRAVEDLVLRYLVSHALWPGTEQDVTFGAQLLGRQPWDQDPAEDAPQRQPAPEPAPPRVPAAEGPAAELATTAPARPAAALGWPVH